MATEPISPSAVRSSSRSKLVAPALVVLGAVAVALAVLRAIKSVPHFDADKVDDVTLGLLALPMLLLVIRQAQSFRVGGDGVEFVRRAEEKMDAAARDLVVTRAQVARLARRSRATLDAAQTARLALVGVGGLPAVADVAGCGPSHAASNPRSAPPGTDGPHEHFGGQSEAQGRRLRARITPVAGTAEWFRIRLWVEALPGASALTEPVVFHLPASFRPRDPVVAPTRGRAVIERLAYGAFVVGAQTDGRRTRLELDLATVGDAPPGFLQQ